MVLFTAAVIAFPVSWKRRAAGVLLCAFMIPAANLLRVASLFIVGRFYSSRMDIVHREVWPIALTIITFALWLAWFEWARRGKDFDLHAA
jgi:exosortase/archaeosortase family protein